ncbi:TPA: thymidylate synthase [Aquificae Joseph's Coat Spring virus]|nr:TPA: thymidylate synthase [Aquificae Joseph's Coat Spring virus]
MQIKDFASPLDFSHAWLCGLGARVCYSKKSLEELLHEPKITDKEFLDRLCSYKHFSVFSHAFVYKHVGSPIAKALASKYFKTYWNEQTPDIIGFSLRHYLEDLSEQEREKAIEQIASITDKPSIVASIENVTLLHKLTDYYGYAVFYITDVSRVLTHQLVRHTSLNFSQRSQRYVLQFPRNKNAPRPEMMIIPPSIKANAHALEIFLKAVKQAEDVYIELINMGIPSEDARFILPHGQKTTIVVSGTLSHIKDFIIKRKIDFAQWEIRDIAFKMAALLDNF